MNKPGFFEGVLVALLAGLFAGVMSFTLGSIFPYTWVLRFTVACIALGYLVYLLKRSNQSVGRVVIFSVWLLFALVVWLLPLPFVVYLALHFGAIWLVRSLYFYTSLVASMVDMALTGFSFLFALWAMLHTHSMFAAVWCFFLAQALFVFIPTGLRNQVKEARHTASHSDRFEHAHQMGEAALKKLFANN